MEQQQLDEKLYDQLISYLAAKGRVREDFGAGILTISELHGQPLDPPKRLHVTPQSLVDHVRATADDAASAFPDITPTEAAWRVFTQDIGSAVEHAGPDETEIVVDGTEVVARPPQ